MMELCGCQGCGVRSGPNERLLMERANAKTLTLDSNRSVSIEFDRFDIVFPYDYDFAACLDEACIQASVQLLIVFSLNFYEIYIYFSFHFGCSYVAVLIVAAEFDK